MKIALVTSMSGIGGTENATKRLALLLLKKNHEVSLFSCDGPFIQELINAGVNWHKISLYPTKKIDYLNLLMKLVKALRDKPVDVIHCQMARPVIPIWIASKFQVYTPRIVWHSRGLDAKTYPYTSKVFSFINIYSLANCKHEKEKLIRHGYKPKLVNYSYNALDSYLLHISRISSKPTHSRKIVIGSISRLEKSRSVDKAISIFSQLYKKNKSIQLIIAGDGSERKNLERLVNSLELSNSVKFLGSVKKQENFYKEIDIFINTLSLGGDDGAGIGNNIIEAGIFRKPVVSFNSCGIKEVIINKKTGFLVELNDTNSFTRSVEYIISHPIESQKLAENLHKHILKICADDEIYNQTIKSYV